MNTKIHAAEIDIINRRNRVIKGGILNTSLTIIDITNIQNYKGERKL